MSYHCGLCGETTSVNDPCDWYNEICIDGIGMGDGVCHDCFNAWKCKPEEIDSDQWDQFAVAVFRNRSKSAKPTHFVAGKTVRELETKLSELNLPDSAYVNWVEIDNNYPLIQDMNDQLAPETLFWKEKCAIEGRNELSCSQHYSISMPGYVRGEVNEHRFQSRVLWLVHQLKKRDRLTLDTLENMHLHMLEQEFEQQDEEEKEKEKETAAESKSDKDVEMKPKGDPEPEPTDADLDEEDVGDLESTACRSSHDLVPWKQLGQNMIKYFERFVHASEDEQRDNLGHMCNFVSTCKIGGKTLRETYLTRQLARVMSRLKDFATDIGIPLKQLAPPLSKKTPESCIKHLLKKKKQEAKASVTPTSSTIVTRSQSKKRKLSDRDHEPEQEPESEPHPKRQKTEVKTGDMDVDNGGRLPLPLQNIVHDYAAMGIAEAIEHMDRICGKLIGKYIADKEVQQEEEEEEDKEEELNE